jgi:hypothetical protein
MRESSPTRASEGGSGSRHEHRPSPCCRRGARLRRAGVHRGEVRLTTKPKRGEPQDRQRDATSPHGRGGANRRGGEKPRGRNTDGAWSLRPEGTAAMPRREWTPRLHRWRGGLWKSQERKPGSDVGRHGPGGRRERRRQGHEGRARTSSRVSARPVRRTLEGRRLARASCQGRGGRWSGPTSHDVEREHDRKVAHVPVDPANPIPGPSRAETRGRSPVRGSIL